MEQRFLGWWLALTGLVVALAVVGVLILRKRAAGPTIIPLIQTETGSRATGSSAPSFKPLDEYEQARAYADGDTPASQTEEEVQLDTTS